MQLDQVFAARPVVQVIYVLGNKRKLSNLLLQTYQGLVGRVWLQGSKQFPAPIIEVPHQLRVAGKGLRRSQISGPETLPEPVLASKSGHSALGRDAGTGKYSDSFTFSQPEAGLLKIRCNGIHQMVPSVTRLLKS
jgi:hypothetical protein